jgi:hypothetical protein
MNFEEMTGETQYRTPEPDFDYTYPKRLTLRPDQPHLLEWTKFFEDQYQSECARLGYTPDPLQTRLL